MRDLLVWPWESKSKHKAWRRGSIIVGFPIAVVIDGSAGPREVVL